MTIDLTTAQAAVGDATTGVLRDNTSGDISAADLRRVLTTIITEIAAAAGPGEQTTQASVYALLKMILQEGTNVTLTEADDSATIHITAAGGGDAEALDANGLLALLSTGGGVAVAIDSNDSSKVSIRLTDERFTATLKTLYDGYDARITAAAAAAEGDELTVVTALPAIAAHSPGDVVVLTEATDDNDPGVYVLIEATTTPVFEGLIRVGTHGSGALEINHPEINPNDALNFLEWETSSNFDAQWDTFTLLSRAVIGATPPSLLHFRATHYKADGTAIDDTADAITDTGTQIGREASYDTDSARAYGSGGNLNTAWRSFVAGGRVRFNFFTDSNLTTPLISNTARTWINVTDDEEYIARVNRSLDILEREKDLLDKDIFTFGFYAQAEDLFDAIPSHGRVVIGHSAEVPVLYSYRAGNIGTLVIEKGVGSTRIAGLPLSPVVRLWSPYANGFVTVAPMSSRRDSVSEVNAVGRWNLRPAVAAAGREIYDSIGRRTTKDRLIAEQAIDLARQNAGLIEGLEQHLSLSDNWINASGAAGYGIQLSSTSTTFGDIDQTGQSNFHGSGDLSADAFTDFMAVSVPRGLDMAEFRVALGNWALTDTADPNSARTRAALDTFLLGSEDFALMIREGNAATGNQRIIEDPDPDKDYYVLVDSSGVPRQYSFEAQSYFRVQRDMRSVSPTGNVFTDADMTKLDGIQANAEVNDTAAEIVTKLESLSGNSRLNATAIRNLPSGGGGGLASVSTDATISGDGTSGDPLAVANPFTATDETKLDGIEENATADQTAGEIVGLIEGLSGNARLDATSLRNLPSGGGTVAAGPLQANPITARSSAYTGSAEQSIDLTDQTRNATYYESRVLLATVSYSISGTTQEMAVVIRGEELDGYNMQLQGQGPFRVVLGLTGTAPATAITFDPSGTTTAFQIQFFELVGAKGDKGDPGEGSEGFLDQVVTLTGAVTQPALNQNGVLFNSNATTRRTVTFQFDNINYPEGYRVGIRASNTGTVVVNQTVSTLTEHKFTVTEGQLLVLIKEPGESNFIELDNSEEIDQRARDAITALQHLTNDLEVGRGVPGSWRTAEEIKIKIASRDTPWTLGDARSHATFANEVASTGTQADQYILIRMDHSAEASEFRVKIDPVYDSDADEGTHYLPISEMDPVGNSLPVNGVIQYKFFTQFNTATVTNGHSAELEESFGRDDTGRSTYSGILDGGARVEEYPSLAGLVIQISQTDYDALPDDIKENGKIYSIYDPDAPTASPGPPAFLRQESAGVNEITYYFGPSNTGGRVQFYEYRSALRSANFSGNWTRISAHAGEFTVRSLNAGTQYKAQIRAGNTIGTSAAVAGDGATLAS